MASPISFPYTSYKQILDALRKESVRLFLLACREWKASRAAKPDPARIQSSSDVTRTIMMLSTITRRSSVIARHIAAMPVLEEERDGRIEQRLDLVFSVFAKNKIDLETYHSWVDSDMNRELDEELNAAFRDDDSDDDEESQDADIMGRRPMILVGELCCDFGIATHTLSLDWLEPAPPELRLLCARAAASYIRPGRRVAKGVRLKAHSHPRS